MSVTPEKIVEAVKRMGGSEEMASDLVEAVQSYVAESQEANQAKFKSILNKAKALCVEYVEQEILKNARKLQVYIESKEAEFSEAAERARKLEESQANIQLRKIASVVNGGNTNGFVNSAQIDALQKSQERLEKAYVALKEENMKLATASSRANAIAERAIYKAKSYRSLLSKVNLSEDMTQEEGINKVSEGGKRLPPLPAGTVLPTHNDAPEEPMTPERILSSRNSEKAYHHARNTIKGRWPEAEEFIKDDPEVASDYARDVIRSDWPEAGVYGDTREPQEPNEFEKLEESRRQRRRMIGEGMAPERILSSRNAKEAYYYAANVIKGRWPEAEEFIKDDPEVAYDYARDVIRSDWPEAGVHGDIRESRRQRRRMIGESRIRSSRPVTGSPMASRPFSAQQSSDPVVNQIARNIPIDL